MMIIPYYPFDLDTPDAIWSFSTLGTAGVNLRAARHGRLMSLDGACDTTLAIDISSTFRYDIDVRAIFLGVFSSLMTSPYAKLAGYDLCLVTIDTPHAVDGSRQSILRFEMALQVAQAFEAFTCEVSTRPRAQAPRTHLARVSDASERSPRKRSARHPKISRHRAQ